LLTPTLSLLTGSLTLPYPATTGFFPHGQVWLSAELLKQAYLTPDVWGWVSVCCPVLLGVGSLRSVSVRITGDA
jgi:hypothetical protein